MISTPHWCKHLWFQNTLIYVSFCRSLNRILPQLLLWSILEIYISIFDDAHGQVEGRGEGQAGPLGQTHWVIWSKFWPQQKQIFLIEFQLFLPWLLFHCSLMIKHPFTLHINALHHWWLVSTATTALHHLCQQWFHYTVVINSSYCRSFNRILPQLLLWSILEIYIYI